MPTLRIGILGLGRMGSGMARRLLDSGFPLSVWNRTAGSAQTLAAAGATLKESPAAALTGVDAVLISLSDADAVDAVLFGPAGAAGTLRPGLPVINTTTVSPEYAVGLSARLGRQGVPYLDVALLGNPFQAGEGQLRVIAAGGRADLAVARPVLDALGKQVTYVGPVGQAAATKLVFNALLGAQLAALAEAMAYGVRAGLDYNLLLGAIAESGFSSKVMAFRAALAQQHKYQPAAFSSALMGKDLGLVLAEGQRHAVEMPLLAAAGAHFQEIIERGDGDLDAAVVIERGTERAAASLSADA
jgi:3-hydroxyisobutyrate dehydrogenase-like beta-hydroxyacid dehydrogenase